MKALCFLELPSLNHPGLCERLDAASVNVAYFRDEAFVGRSYKCEINALPLVLALLAVLAEEKYPQEAGGAALLRELDPGYLSAESCLGEEEAWEILDFLAGADCVIVDDFSRSEEVGNVKFFLALLSRKFALRVLDPAGAELDLAGAAFCGLGEPGNYDGPVVFLTRSGGRLGETSEEAELLCSRSFLALAKVADGDAVSLKIGDENFQTKIKIDEKLRGTVALLGMGSGPAGWGVPGGSGGRPPDKDGSKPLPAAARAEPRENFGFFKISQIKKVDEKAPQGGGARGGEAPPENSSSFSLFLKNKKWKQQ